MSVPDLSHRAIERRAEEARAEKPRDRRLEALCGAVQRGFEWPATLPVDRRAALARRTRQR